MFLSDTLSRAHLSEIHSCVFTHQLEETDHTTLLAIPPDQLEKIKQVSAEDLGLTELWSTIHTVAMSRPQVSSRWECACILRCSRQTYSSRHIGLQGTIDCDPKHTQEGDDRARTCHTHWHRRLPTTCPRHHVLATHVYTTERLHLKVRCVHDSLTTTKQGANSTTWVCSKVVVKGWSRPLWIERPHSTCGEWLL